MFIEKMWKKNMKKVLKATTDFDENKIEKIIDKEFKENFKDHEAIIHNSYEREIMDTTLAECLDWIQERRPIVCESGGFFKRKDEQEALHAKIVQGNLNERQKLKKTMFEYIVAEDKVNEKFYNNLQLAEKLRANAPYGVDSNIYSFSYSYIIASTTTFVGRGQTSIAILCFEDLLYDSVKFWKMEELFTWVSNVLSEKKKWKFDTNDIIDKIPSRDRLVKKLIEKTSPEVCNEDLIVTLVDRLSEEEFIRLYYKSNFREFCKNKKIKSLIKHIISGKSDLHDPYKPGEDIAAELALICELFDEFVQYSHRYFRYEDKARNIRRNATIISDTDSALLQLGDTVYWLMEEFGIVYDEKNRIDLKLVGMIIAILTKAVTSTFATYLDWVNVDNSNNNVKMKNELLMETCLATLLKKAYISSIITKEGKHLKKPRLDLKGVTFMKSSSTKRTSEFITNDIIMEEILNTKGKVNIVRINRKINKYMKDIRERIEKGDLEYHNQATKVKDFAAYASPSSIPGAVGTHLWNLLHPEEPIQLPDTVTLIKLNGTKKSELEPVRKIDEELYEKLVFYMENDEMFKKGIRYIALPGDVEKIPEWALSIMDVDGVVSKNMGLFAQITAPLNMPQITVTRKDGDLKFFSGVLKL